MKFSIKDLVTFTEEIFNGKLHFCAVLALYKHRQAQVCAVGWKYKKRKINNIKVFLISCFHTNVSIFRDTYAMNIFDITKTFN